MITITLYIRLLQQHLVILNHNDAVKDREAIRKSLGNTSGFSSFQVQMYEVY